MKVLLVNITCSSYIAPFSHTFVSVLCIIINAYSTIKETIWECAWTCMYDGRDLKRLLYISYVNSFDDFFSFQKKGEIRSNNRCVCTWLASNYNTHSMWVIHKSIYMHIKSSWNARVVSEQKFVSALHFLHLWNIRFNIDLRLMTFSLFKVFSFLYHTFNRKLMILIGALIRFKKLSIKTIKMISTIRV